MRAICAVFRKSVVTAAALACISALGTSPGYAQDSSASLDSITAAKVTDTLDYVFTGKTRFIIAHALSTIVNADVILILEEGSIVEQCTHQELLARSAKYRQFSRRAS